MAQSITELILKFKGDDKDLKATMAQVRAELSQTSKTQTAVNKGELSMRSQLSAASSLQRQRSAALIAQWKLQERAAVQAASGVLPLRQTLQNLSTTVATLQGPLGGIAGRLSSLGSLTDQLSASVRGSSSAVSVLLPLLGGVAVGIGAIIAAGVGIFKLAQSTAAFGGHLKDLSDQTGISTESLSTLKVATDLTGGSIDSVNTTLARYLKGVSDANHGNEELRKKFLQVGFTAKDLRDAYVSSDAAIRILLDRVGSLASDQDRLNAFQKLGIRNGTELNAVIKAMDGSFTAFQAKVRAMGLVITPEQAEAADKFDDSLKLLTLQVKGMSYSIARQYLPQIGGAIADVSESLTGNQNRWSAWGDFIKTEIIGIRVAAAGLAAFLQSLPVVGGQAGAAALIGIDAAIRKSRELKAADRVEADAPVALSGKRRELGDKASGTAKSRTDQVFKAELDAAKAAAEKELEQQRHLGQLLQITFDENRATLEEFYKGRQTLIDAHFNTLIDQINAEQVALDEARARGRIKAEDARKKEEELTARTTAAQNKLDEETRRTKLELQRTLDKAELDLNQQLAAIRESARESELRRTQDLLDRQLIFASEAISHRLAVEEEGQKDRALLLDLEIKQLSTSAERKIALDNEKIISEQKFTDETKRLIQERVDARVKEAFEATPPPDQRDRIPPTTIPILEMPPEVSIWIDLMGSIQRRMVEFSGFIRGTFIESFHLMVDAIGDSIAAWALYDESIGEALKKALAQMLAHISAEATIQALLHAAYAIGKLAFGDFAGAARHGLAVLKFGAVAAATGLAARAISGNSFSGAGGESNSVNGTAGAIEPAPDRRIREPRDIDRRGAPVRVEVALSFTKDFRDVVETKVIEAYRSNGRIRNVLLTDGQG